MNGLLKKFMKFAALGRSVFPTSRRYFFRLIWVGCISICVPIVLAGTIYYNFSMERVRQQILDESKSSLIEIKDRAEHIFQEVEKESLQLAGDPIIYQVFNGQMADHSLVWHMALLDQMALIKNGNYVTSDIMFYTNQEDAVLTNQYGAVSKEDLPKREDWDALLALEVNSAWRMRSPANDQITFVRKLPLSGNNGSPWKGFLAFEVDLAKLRQVVHKDIAIIVSGNEMVIVNFPGISKLDNEKLGTFLEQLAVHPVLRQIGESGANVGSLHTEGFDQNKAHFTYSKNMLGRTYISVVPEKLIADRLLWIRLLTLLIVLFFLIIGGLLTYFNTVMAYNPIQKLVEFGRSLNGSHIPSRDNEFEYLKECMDYLKQETEKLERYMERLQPTLRERCLQRLLDGEYVRSELLIQDCRTYGLEVNSGYLVLVVQVEEMKKRKRFLPGDKPIVAFAVTNVMQELLDKQTELKGHVFSYQGHGVALLQWPAESFQRKIPGEILDYSQSVRESLRNYLSFEATIGIGRLYHHIADVPVSFKEAVIALQYRMYRDTDSILYIEDLENSKKQASYRYPRYLENAIIYAFGKGDAHEAGRALEQFAETVRRSESYNFISQSYHVLLSSILSSLEKQGVSILDILEFNLFGELHHQETTREMNDWFIDVLFPLYQQVSDGSGKTAGRSLIRQVCKHIREHCMDELSLVQCAELVGVSPSYLSRLFKKEMGINFLEYVVECKVEEVKRLLLETDLSISDIARRIGYSERNMSRIFQKKTRMTPSSFRAAHR